MGLHLSVEEGIVPAPPTPCLDLGGACFPCKQVPLATAHLWLVRTDSKYP